MVKEIVNFLLFCSCCSAGCSPLAPFLTGCEPGAHGSGGGLTTCTVATPTPEDGTRDTGYAAHRPFPASAMHTASGLGSVQTVHAPNVQPSLPVELWLPRCQRLSGMPRA